MNNPAVHLTMSSFKSEKNHGRNKARPSLSNPRSRIRSASTALLFMAIAGLNGEKCNKYTNLWKLRSPRGNLPEIVSTVEEKGEFYVWKWIQQTTVVKLRLHPGHIGCGKYLTGSSSTCATFKCKQAQIYTKKTNQKAREKYWTNCWKIKILDEMNNEQIEIHWGMDMMC